jgi:hypothetical protein
MMGSIPSLNSKDKVKGYLVVRRDNHLLMMQLNIKKQINVFCMFISNLLKVPGPGNYR